MRFNPYAKRIHSVSKHNPVFLARKLNHHILDLKTGSLSILSFFHWFAYCDDCCNSFLIQITLEINRRAKMKSSIQNCSLIQDVLPDEIQTQLPNDFRICSARGKKGWEVQGLALNDSGWGWN